MNIDLESIVTNIQDELVINEDVIIPNTLLENSQIRKLSQVHFNGNIKKGLDNDYIISGTITGNMTVPDDVTLEDVIVPFKSLIEESFKENGNELEGLKIENNIVDLVPLIWEMIQVEIPSKIRADKKDIKLEGKGWRLINEDDIHSTNQPFKDLDKLLEKGRRD